MKNPVTVASGTFGYGEEYAELFDISRLGAITVKGIRKEPCDGNPTPRIYEVPGGMLNAIGLQGPGASGFVENYLPFLRAKNVPVIVNIWGTSVEGYAETAAELGGAEGVSALEINVSCPNVKHGGASFGGDPKSVAAVVAAVREKVSPAMTLIAKLAPNVPDIKPFVRAAEDAGTDALAISNTIPAMAIDIEKRCPALANTVGGLSGAAIHPAAVKLVWDAAGVAKVPVIGMGGIFTPQDAIEFLCAGATAVAVGTANFIDPTTPLKVIEGIADYMTKHGFENVADIKIR